MWPWPLTYNLDLWLTLTSHISICRNWFRGYLSMYLCIYVCPQQCPRLCKWREQAPQGRRDAQCSPPKKRKQKLHALRLKQNRKSCKAGLRRHRRRWTAKGCGSVSSQLYMWLSSRSIHRFMIYRQKSLMLTGTHTQWHTDISAYRVASNLWTWLKITYSDLLDSTMYMKWSLLRRRSAWRQGRQRQR